MFRFYNYVFFIGLSSFFGAVKMLWSSSRVVSSEKLVLFGSLGGLVWKSKNTPVLFKIMEMYWHFYAKPVFDKFDFGFLCNLKINHWRYKIYKKYIACNRKFMGLIYLISKIFWLYLKYLKLSSFFFYLKTKNVDTKMYALTKSLKMYCKVPCKFLLGTGN